MPHIPGHVEASDGPYDDQVGFVYISLNEDVARENIRDGFGLLFFNTSGAQLYHGQKIQFLPRYFQGSNGPLVMAMDVVSEEVHKLAEKFESLTKQKKEQELASLNKTNNVKLKGAKPITIQDIHEVERREKEFKGSEAYHKIYMDNGKLKSPRSPEEVIRWIMDNAIGIDKMHLISKDLIKNYRNGKTVKSAAAVKKMQKK